METCDLKSDGGTTFILDSVVDDCGRLPIGSLLQCVV